MGEMKLKNKEWWDKILNEWDIEQNTFLKWIKKSLWVLAATIVISQWAHAKEINMWNIQNIKEVQEICSKVAEDTNGNTYILRIPSQLYEENKDQITSQFPENEFCTYNVSVKEDGKNFYKVYYAGAFGDTDASDVVEKQRQDTEQAHLNLEMARLELEQAKKGLEQEWYTIQLYKKLSLVVNKIDDSNFVLNTLTEINESLNIEKLEAEDYRKISRWLGVTYQAVDNRSKAVILEIADKLSIKRKGITNMQL